jgi:hypothetical protein
MEVYEVAPNIDGFRLNAAPGTSLQVAVLAIHSDDTVGQTEVAPIVVSPSLLALDY